MEGNKLDFDELMNFFICMHREVGGIQLLIPLATGNLVN